MQYDLKRLIRKSQIKLKKVVSPRSSLLRPTHNLLITANVITQAQISKKGPNKNSLLCKCSYTAFFTLFYFDLVCGSKITFTCNYYPLHSTVLLLSPRVLLQGNSIRKPKFSRIPRTRVISKDSDYYTWTLTHDHSQITKGHNTPTS